MSSKYDQTFEVEDHRGLREVHLAFADVLNHMVPLVGEYRIKLNVEVVTKLDDEREAQELKEKSEAAKAEFFRALKSMRSTIEDFPRYRDRANRVDPARLV